MFPRFPREHPDGQRGGVAERLREMPDQLGKHVQHLRTAGERVVAQAEVSRDGLGIAALVKGAFGEAQRERRDFAGTLPGGDGPHQARIDAAAQEQAEGHVAAQPQGDGGGQQLFQLI